MEKEKGKVAFRILRVLIILALLGVVAYEGVMIYGDQKEYAVAENEYEDLNNKYVAVLPGKKEEPVATEEEDTEETVTYPNLEVDFASLKALNSDIIGWLYFPALEISYPIVKENSIDQYLYRTFDGTYNRAGCIFMDVLSNPDFSGPSDMLFGHNMKNGSMFGSLKRLYKEKDKDLLADDPYVYIFTEDNTYRYRIFSYYTTTQGSYSYTEVKTDKEYDDYLAYVKRNSMIELPDGLDFKNRPPLLTLSTCSGNTGSGMRFVVHTVRN